jgi:pseudouridine synthase
MSNGIPMLGTVTNKCHVEMLSNYVFKIILTQGLNRQIRRMCSFCGYEVRKLKRVRIMNIGLKNLKIGEWREFTPQELDGILKMVATSKKTAEGFNVDDYED